MVKSLLLAICLGTTLLLHGVIANAQQPYTFITNINNQFDSLRNTIPREKLYVHLDRTIYIPQDTLWFKAYLIDASTNSFSQISGLVYFEMIDSDGKIIQTISLPTAMGITWGGFALKPDLYKVGTYTFRGYTNWMKNFGETHIFKKDIQIIDFIKEEAIRNNRKLKINTSPKTATPKSKPKEVDIQFLPESGVWIPEVLQKMAFKAIDESGKGVKVSGEIIDSKQQSVISFQSNDKGMGFFEMLPIASESYSVKISGNEIINRTKFPKTSATGTYLKVQNEYKYDSLSVFIHSDLPPQNLLLLGQSKGVTCFNAELKSKTAYRVIKIAKSLFPTGVCQIVLKNANGQTLNERNFFVNHQNELKINASTQNTSYSLRDSISVNLSVLDETNKAVSGSFSVAVTDDNQINKDILNDENICSYFLLHADLKGEIESPGSYFQGFNEQKHNDLEALMLTQGWVSYNWDISKKPVFKSEKDFTISGSVTNMLNKPVSNAKIILLGKKNYTSLRDTVTNDDGKFVFDNFPAIDSTSFLIQAKNAKGKSGTLGIQLNEFKPAFFSQAIKNKKLIADEPLDSIAEQFIAIKNEEHDRGVKSGIILQEVKIIGKKIIKGSKNLNGDGNADHTITETDLNKVAKKTLLNVIQENVKGFRRGLSPDKKTTEYLIYTKFFKLIIDGVDVDFFYDPQSVTINPYFNQNHIDFIKGYLDHYQAEDIAGIELMESFKYGNTYKMEYTDPMDSKEYAFIEVTTRTGEGPFLRKASNVYLYKPQFSYGDNKVFYSPRYTLANKTDKKPDFRSTIFWMPNLVTDNDGKGGFSFFSADKKGSYTVWIEGSDMNGNFGFKSMKLEIK